MLYLVSFSTESCLGAALISFLGCHHLRGCSLLAETGSILFQAAQKEWLLTIPSWALWWPKLRTPLELTDPNLLPCSTTGAFYYLRHPHSLHDSLDPGRPQCLSQNSAISFSVHLSERDISPYSRSLRVLILCFCVIPACGGSFPHLFISWYLPHRFTTS